MDSINETVVFVMSFCYIYITLGILAALAPIYFPYKIDQAYTQNEA